MSDRTVGRDERVKDVRKEVLQQARQEASTELDPYGDDADWLAENANAEAKAECAKPPRFGR